MLTTESKSQSDHSFPHWFTPHYLWNWTHCMWWMDGGALLIFCSWFNHMKIQANWRGQVYRPFCGTRITISLGWLGTSAFCPQTILEVLGKFLKKRGQFSCPLLLTSLCCYWRERERLPWKKITVNLFGSMVHVFQNRKRVLVVNDWMKPSLFSASDFTCIFFSSSLLLSIFAPTSIQCGCDLDQCNVCEKCIFWSYYWFGIFVRHRVIFSVLQSFSRLT